MTPRLDLPTYFRLQDQAAESSLADNEDARRLITVADDAVALLGHLLQCMSFPVPKQTTFRVLGCEVLSGCIVAARIALWGNLAESFACLRPAVEAAVILSVVADRKEYEGFVHEFTSRRLRRFAYDECKASLKEEKPGLERLVGLMSAMGAHLTASRLQVQSYSWSGETFDRAGFSLDLEAVVASLFYLPVPLISSVHSVLLGEAQEGRDPAQLSDFDSLSQRYMSLRADLDGEDPAITANDP